MYGSYSVVNAIGFKNPVVFVEPSSQKDKRVIGVLSKVVEDEQKLKMLSVDPLFFNSTSNEDGTIYDLIDDSTLITLRQDLIDNYDAVFINAVGDGLIKVSADAGDIDNGDYLTTDINGFAKRQRRDVLTNSTVAKALEDVVFSDPNEVRLIACTYHCG